MTSVLAIGNFSVSDQAARLDQLENGTISGAGLDVSMNEPDIDPRFLKPNNVVPQPHEGSATEETRAAMEHSTTRHARARKGK